MHSQHPFQHQCTKWKRHTFEVPFLRCRFLAVRSVTWAQYVSQSLNSSFSFFEISKAKLPAVFPFPAVGIAISLHSGEGSLPSRPCAASIRWSLHSGEGSIALTPSQCSRSICWSLSASIMACCILCSPILVSCVSLIGRPCGLLWTPSCAGTPCEVWIALCGSCEEWREPRSFLESTIACGCDGKSPSWVYIPCMWASSWVVCMSKGGGWEGYKESGSSLGTTALAEDSRSTICFCSSKSVPINPLINQTQQSLETCNKWYRILHLHQSLTTADIQYWLTSSTIFCQKIHRECINFELTSSLLPDHIILALNVLPLKPPQPTISSPYYHTLELYYQI